MAWNINDGVNTYRTDDGRTFTTEKEAQEHANSLGGSGGSSGTKSGGSASPNYAAWASGDLKNLWNLYNAGEWQKMLNYKWNWAEHAPEADLLMAVAYAKTGNYQRALSRSDFGVKGRASCGGWFTASEQQNKLKEFAFQEAIQAFERANGHPLTQADLIKECEANMVYTDLSGTHISDVDKIIWKALTGRDMTSADERRIIRESRKSSGSSSSSTSSIGGGSILFCIIGAIVVAIIGFSILGWLGLIGGAVGGFFAGKWLSGKIIGKILLIALLVLVGGTFIISKF